MIPQTAITIMFNPEQIAIIRRLSAGAARGGASNIYSGQARRSNLLSDQMVGQLGDAALCLHFYGNLDDYIARTEHCNRSYDHSDNGRDLTGKDIDIKTFRMHKGPDYPYRLLVATTEFKPAWTYVMGLVPVGRDDLVHLIGYIRSEDLPETVVLTRCENRAVHMPALRPLPASLDAMLDDDVLPAKPTAVPAPEVFVQLPLFQTRTAYDE